jgi:hypothetical protein
MAAVQFRKKPVVVTAVQFTGDNVNEIHALTGPPNFGLVDAEDREADPDITAEVFDHLHSTWVGVKTGQWIIRGVQGEFYPIDESVLASTYDRLDALGLVALS